MYKYRQPQNGKQLTVSLMLYKIKPFQKTPWCGEIPTEKVFLVDWTEVKCTALQKGKKYIKQWKGTFELQKHKSVLKCLSLQIYIKRLFWTSDLTLTIDLKIWMRTQTTLEKNWAQVQQLRNGKSWKWRFFCNLTSENAFQVK